MTKKRTKTPLPCIIKNGKWFNTITQRYVSEPYAKRINSYFKKRPLGAVVRARGHAVYKPEGKKQISEQSKEIREMLYGKGTQTVKTKTRKGKIVYYSPMHDEFLSDDVLRKLKKLDYRKGNINVELYRLTRAKDNIYHILTRDIDQRLTSGGMVDFFRPKAIWIFNSMMKETLKICKKHKFQGVMLIYCHISNYFYSDIDGWEKGIAFGFVTPNKKGQNLMKNKFKDILDWYYNKLEIDAYHNIMVQKMSFYIYAYSSGVTQLQREIAKYRVGITHMPYKKDKGDKFVKKEFL